MLRVSGFTFNSMGRKFPQNYAVLRRSLPEGENRLIYGTVWCGREDSNFHGLSPTTTSTLRVYQFRHDRTQSASEAIAPAGRWAPLAARAASGKRLMQAT